MEELTLEQPSPLVGTVNELIEAFDESQPSCSKRYQEWITAQNGECSLPDSWKDHLSTNNDELGYFCVETALSLLFRTVVASEIVKKPPNNFEELRLWNHQTSQAHYSELCDSKYAWPFELSNEESSIPLPDKFFNINYIKNQESDDILGDIYRRVFDKSLRKELGEFYTNKEIISYLLDKSGYDKDQWDMRLLDPACGSGSFIISAAQRLLDSKPDDLTDAEAIYRICNSPLLVGFDINPFACEIARLRLFLTFYPSLKGDDNITIQKLPIFNIDSLARDYTDIGDDADRKLSQFTDDGDIRGKYLEEVKIQEVAPEDHKPNEGTTLDKLFSEYKKDPTRPKPNTEHGKFDKLIGRILRDNIKYDSVVGNPPYVRIQKVPEKRRSEYKNGFKSATGRFDLSVLFIELGIECLHNQGQIGYITSNKFLTTKYGNGIRAYLRDNTAIDTIIDFTDTDVFDVAVLPCILVAQKGTTSESIGYGILKQSDNRKNSNECGDIISVVDSHISDNLFEGRFTIGLNGDKETVKIRCFETNLPESKEATWTFIPEKERTVVDKIDKEKSADLGSIAEKISVGIKTTANDVFVDPITDSKIEKEDLERELIHPAISGKNVSKWSIEWCSEDSKKPSYILYPHEIVNGSVEPVELDNYPNIKSYLQENYKQLAGRSYLEEAGRKWYECWVPQHPNYFNVENKIITPEMASENSFALDTTGFYCIGSCYSILLENDDPILYRFITGLLNSDLVEFYLKADSSTQLYADRFRYNKSYIENLPVIYTDPSEVDKQSTSQNTIDEIGSLGETMMYIAKLVDKVQAGELETESVKDDINELVYQSFGITDKEQRLIENYLEFVSSE